VATLPLQVVTVCVPVKLQLLSLVLVQVPVEGVQVVPKFAVTSAVPPAGICTVNDPPEVVRVDPVVLEFMLQLVKPAVLETMLVVLPESPIGVPEQVLLPLTVKVLDGPEGLQSPIV
jgi:hypothetical protein